MSSALFLDTLRRAGLEEFYLNFTMGGINSLDSLSRLKFNDYGTFGIVSSEDRKKMSALVESLPALVNNAKKSQQSQQPLQQPHPQGKYTL